MWPATPSSKPNLLNRRKLAAKRCLRCSRSASTLSKVGGNGIINSRAAIPGVYGPDAAEADLDGLFKQVVAGGHGRQWTEVAGLAFHQVIEGQTDSHADG